MKQINLARAYAKGIDQAPRKTAIVADLVRGRSVEDALVILDHTPRRAAKPIKKLIESARANALNNHNFESAGLVVKTISVSNGKRYRRYMPASKGRALPYEVVASNILVELAGKQKTVKQKPSKKTTVKKTTKAVKDDKETK